MPESYCTNQEIIDAMPDAQITLGSYGTILTTLAERASRLIDRYTGRKPGAYKVAADVTLYFDGSGKKELWIDELATAPTSVSVAESGDIKTPDYTLWAANEYLLWPYNAADKGEPYLRLDLDVINGTKSSWYRFPKAVKIVGKFGYSTTPPDDVKQATIIQAMRAFKRGQQGFKDAGGIPELGKIMYVKELDPEVKLLIEHLRRITI